MYAKIHTPKINSTIRIFSPGKFRVGLSSWKQNPFFHSLTMGISINVLKNNLLLTNLIPLPPEEQQTNHLVAPLPKMFNFYIILSILLFFFFDKNITHTY